MVSAGYHQPRAERTLERDLCTAAQGKKYTNSCALRQLRHKSHPIIIEMDVSWSTFQMYGGRVLSTFATLDHSSPCTKDVIRLLESIPVDTSKATKNEFSRVIEG